MPAYLIGNYTVTDPDKYKEYQRASRPIMAGGGKLLVLDSDSAMKEGDAQHQTVVIEYPTREAAEAAYASEDYQAVIGIRNGATANGRLVIVDGFVPPSR